MSEIQRYDVDKYGNISGEELGGLVDYGDHVAALAEKQAEIDRLEAQCKKVYCAYCSFETDADTAMQDLQKHVATCAHHPLYKAKAEIDQLKKEIDDYQIDLCKKCGTFYFQTEGCTCGTRRRLLFDFCAWLEKHGYLDTDWRDEMPDAITRYMEGEDKRGTICP